MKKYNIVLIRALACIAVILYHMNNMMFGIGGTTSSLLAIGGIAPYFFFVISGFLVSVKKNVGDIKTYYVKRILRICPVYYLVIVYNIFFWGILLNWNWPVDSSGMYWWRYFLFLSTTVPTGEGLWINVNATWTISAFMFFYKAVYVFAAVVLALVFTELVYRYVEMPANRLAKKMTLKAQRS